MRHIVGPHALARTALTGAVVIGALLLAGCTEADANTDPTDAPTASPSTAPSASPSEEPGDLAFVLPTDCVSILPPARIASFEAAGLVLLGGPGGLYGEDYLLEPTPEEVAGGITCIWGDEAVPQSTVTISVAPVTTSNRGTIVNDLIAQGLNEAETDDGLTYSELGDEVSAPAILNIVRRESWISVIEAVGGETRFAEATAIVEEVSGLVYGAN